MTRPEMAPDIDWYEALEVAEYYAGLKPNVTAHWTEAGLRNLAHAYLDLMKENRDLSIGLLDALVRRPEDTP